MSTTKRRESARRIKSPDGTLLCSCGCGEVPKPPRRTWFSDACVDAWKLKNDPSHVRRLVFERDRGICALCGCDAEATYRAWQEYHRDAGRLAAWLLNAYRWNVEWDRCGGRFRFRDQPPVTAREQAAYRRAIVAKYGPAGAWTPGRRTAWDADHIVPVCRGGGQCGLENYRTLCVPCHKRETARLAAERAAERRLKEWEPELFASA